LRQPSPNRPRPLQAECKKIKKWTGRQWHVETSGVQEPECIPAGVLMIFENRSGAGVDFFKEGPEWGQSHFT